MATVPDEANDEIERVSPTYQSEADVDFEDVDTIIHNETWPTSKSTGVQLTFERMEYLGKQVERMNALNLNASRGIKSSYLEMQKDGADDSWDFGEDSFFDGARSVMEDHFAACSRYDEVDRHLLDLLGPDCEDQLFKNQQRIVAYFRHKATLVNKQSRRRSSVGSTGRPVSSQSVKIATSETDRAKTGSSPKVVIPHDSSDESDVSDSTQKKSEPSSPSSKRAQIAPQFKSNSPVAGCPTKTAVSRARRASNVNSAVSVARRASIARGLAPVVKMDSINSDDSDESVNHTRRPLKPRNVPRNAEEETQQPAKKGVAKRKAAKGSQLPAISLSGQRRGMG